MMLSGSPIFYIQNRTTRTCNQRGQTEQDCQHSTVRTVLLGTEHLEQDTKDRIAGTGQPEKVSLNRTAPTSKTGQEDDGMQISVKHNCM
jgi:hypothetical protein